MLSPDALSTLRAMAQQIADELSAEPPADPELRYAYRVACASALTLCDQLDELKSTQSKGGDELMRFAS